MLTDQRRVGREEDSLDAKTESFGAIRVGARMARAKWSAAPHGRSESTAVNGWVSPVVVEDVPLGLPGRD